MLAPSKGENFEEMLHLMQLYSSHKQVINAKAQESLTVSWSEYCWLISCAKSSTVVCRSLQTFLVFSLPTSLFSLYCACTVQDGRGPFLIQFKDFGVCWDPVLALHLIFFQGWKLCSHCSKEVCCPFSRDVVGVCSQIWVLGSSHFCVAHVAGELVACACCFPRVQVFW